MNENWDILGHEWAVRMLKNQLVNGKIRHAYLFSGPDGMGRRTLALKLAQALNCQKSTSPGQPCGECRDCQQLARQEHPDLTIIAVEEDSTSLKVDQVREALHTLSLTPYQAPYRVAILLRFENATINAANALLKTLEEPPPQVVLIITAQDSEALLPTIVSRCELIRLSPLSLDSLARGLQDELELPEEKARFLAHIAAGRPGIALRLFKDPDALAARQAWLDDLLMLMKSSRVNRFNYAESLAKDRYRIQEQLKVWSSFWRDVLLVSTKADVPLINIDRLDPITQLGNSVDSKRARDMVKAVEHTDLLISQNINPRLALENLLLKFSMKELAP